MNHKLMPTRFPWARFAMTYFVVVLAGEAFAGSICIMGGWIHQLGALAMTAAAMLIASLIALLPIVWRVKHSESGIAEGFVVGILLRMGIAIASVIALVAFTESSVMSLGLWASGWYLLLLAVEVILLTKHLRRMEMDSHQIDSMLEDVA